MLDCQNFFGTGKFVLVFVQQKGVCEGGGKGPQHVFGWTLYILNLLYVTQDIFANRQFCLHLCSNSSLLTGQTFPKNSL